jgi:hypothetical protein
MVHRGLPTWGIRKLLGAVHPLPAPTYMVRLKARKTCGTGLGSPRRQPEGMTRHGGWVLHHERLSCRPSRLREIMWKRVDHLRLLAKQSEGWSPNLVVRAPGRYAPKEAHRQMPGMGSWRWRGSTVSSCWDVPNLSQASMVDEGGGHSEKTALPPQVMRGNDLSQQKWKTSELLRLGGWPMNSLTFGSTHSRRADTCQSITRGRDDSPLPWKRGSREW